MKSEDESELPTIDYDQSLFSPSFSDLFYLFLFINF